jgi:sugar phosphate isomerase/epimerase
MRSITRRRFLGATAAAGGAMLVNPAVHAITPFKRPGKQVLKLSLAAYSLRQYFNAKPDTKGAIDIPGFIDYCASLGLDGTELTSYYFPKEITPAYLNGLKRRAHVAGLDISGGAIGNNFTIDPGPKLDAQVALTQTWIDHYADLGAPEIRIFAGSPPKGVSEDEAIKRCIPVIEHACDLASKRGIMLALENHDFSSKVERLMQIIEGVKSPWFGINFDSGNFHSEDPYKDMEAIAPYAINAQIKSEVQPAGQRAQPADLKRVLSILRDGGYCGYFVLEYEAKEDPYAAIPRIIDQMRGIVRGFSAG